MSSTPLRTVSIFLRDPAARGHAVAVLLRYAWMRLLKFGGVSTWIRMRGTSIQLKYRPGCTVTEKCFIVGNYDLNGTALLAETLSSGDVFFDIGANVGPYALLASTLGMRVFAFDGAASAIARLRENFARNDIPDEAAIHAAVTAVDGEVAFADVPGSAINHVANAGTRVRAVSIATLAASLGIPRGVKIDTEGHEPAVFAGMQPLLARAEVKCLIFEANGLCPQTELGGIHRMLVAHGYKVGYFDARARLFTVCKSLGAQSPFGDYHAISADAAELLARKNIRFAMVPCAGQPAVTVRR